jgi:hypothetical protein
MVKPPYEIFINYQDQDLDPDPDLDPDHFCFLPRKEIITHSPISIYQMTQLIEEKRTNHMATIGRLSTFCP